MCNMKRISYFLAAAALFFGAAGVADAQRRETSEQEIAKVYQLEENEAYGVDGLYQGEFFVGIGGGAAVYFGEHDRQMMLQHRLSPAMDVYVGKWLLPWFGLRFAYSGGQAYGLTNADTGKVFSTGEEYKYRISGSKGLFYQKFDYFGVRADAMFNVINAVAGNNPDRFYDISPYVSFGVHKVYNTPLRETCVGLSVGIYNTFRVSKAIDIVLDVHGTAVPEKFEHETGSRPGVKPNGIYSYDGILTAALGIAYNF